VEINGASVVHNPDISKPSRQQSTNQLVWVCSVPLHRPYCSVAALDDGLEANRSLILFKFRIQ
jgi:hypothetical protein